MTVDLTDTARQQFATGIQRVARETGRRWVAAHDCVLVGWDTELPALRRLFPAERDNVLVEARQLPERPPTDEIIVPWRTTHLLPELLAEPARSAPFQGLTSCSGNRTGVIGFDLVPLTTSETVHSIGLSSSFAGNLAAVAHATTVATISAAAAQEYGGWRAMLAGAGLSGPRIQEVLLPAEVAPSTDADLAEARAALTIAGLPMVLIVGSHEPRKNHLSVLHAAELLWREGIELSMVFVGGNAWSSEVFSDRIRELTAKGRPVHTLTAISDRELWAAYRVARFTVFPSLNEGFGLPLAESLAVGTPAITSNYGSMAEIAADGGALLVDPRDVRSIAAGMRRLLTDDALLASLAAAARDRPRRTWDDYAAELWSVLVGS